MSALVAEPGDPADLARLLCRAGHEAMAHHPKHGRNWWGKHSRELHALALLYARPEPAPEPTTTLLEADDEVSGEALVFVLKASFPDMVEATPMESYYRSAIVARNAEVRAFAARRMPTGADAASGARERLDGGGANG